MGVRYCPVEKSWLFVSLLVELVSRFGWRFGQPKEPLASRSDSSKDERAARLLSSPLQVVPNVVSFNAALSSCQKQRAEGDATSTLVPGELLSLGGRF